MRTTTIALLLGATALAGCQNQTADNDQTAATGQDFEQHLQEQLLDAKPGDVITIPPGTHNLSRSLSLTASGVTIKGAGMDKTILSFAKQNSGAEALLVTGDDFTLEDLTLRDSRGDALKINGTKNAVMRRVRTDWTTKDKKSHGAYGLYPVQVTNVLIEDSVANGASDAGIYVGQSKNIVVRNNRAEGNVAGIEIENSTHADVYGNTATGNTGGILVFNMPDLPVPGSRTRVYRNKVVANNTTNFGAEGSAVRSVPAGAGVVVNSNDKVEIFDNQIADNQTANVIISSYFSTGFDTERERSDAYDPYPQDIYITGNRFKGGGTKPGAGFDKLKAVTGGPLPAVLWDGFTDPDVADAGICLQNGDAKLLNADGPDKFANAHIADNVDCKPDQRLQPVTLPKTMDDSS